jgi:hypothetical protein
VLGAPFQGARQARSAVEPAGVARVRVPGARGVADLAVQAAALRVLVEPRAQARPFAQQRLVRDLDRALADREQAAVGEPRDELGDVGTALDLQLRERDPAAHDRAALALALAGEPQQHVARQRLLGSIELHERLLGEPRDGTVDAPAPRVRG